MINQDLAWCLPKIKASTLLFWGENDTFITIYNEPMLLMLQKLHGVTAEKELKKLDFDQRISASIHNHHH